MAQNEGGDSESCDLRKSAKSEKRKDDIVFSLDVTCDAARMSETNASGKKGCERRYYCRATSWCMRKWS